MGRHLIEIDMTGSHGCDRTAKEGEPLKRCSNELCPDCQALAFVEKFKATGAFGYGGGATITHWPGDEHEVVDDLVSGTRQKGHF